MFRLSPSQILPDNSGRVALRPTFVYELSNKYVADPYWFVNPAVVSVQFIADFPGAAYCSIKKKPTIKRHHLKYLGQYAPAWKTMEYMTLGNMLTLYRSLLNLDDKRAIAAKFGINQTSVFENYMESMRCIRNICAHGSVLYDAKLFFRIKRGPAGKLSQDETSRLGGAIKVLAYLLGKVSINRRHEMIISLNDAYMKSINKSPVLGQIIEDASQMKWDLPNISQLDK